LNATWPSRKTSRRSYSRQFLPEVTTALGSGSRPHYLQFSLTSIGG
jgi:hypothetical protein